MKAWKIYGLSALILAFLQLADYFFIKSGIGTANSKLIFGLFGSNFIAIIIAIVCVSVLLIAVKKNDDLLKYLLIVLAGAISNIIDRLIYGGVVDYLKLPLIPRFNFSDCLILIGLILVLSKRFKQLKKYSKKYSNPEYNQTMS